MEFGECVGGSLSSSARCTLRMLVCKPEVLNRVADRVVLRPVGQSFSPGRQKLDQFRTTAGEQR